MLDDATNGVRQPDRPTHWLVPPWPTDATLTDVVSHFVRHHPWDNTNTAQLLAYFKAYQAALDATPPEPHTSTARETWRADMFHCIARCVSVYQEKLATENSDQEAADVRRTRHGSIRQSLPASTAPMIQSR